MKRSLLALPAGMAAAAVLVAMGSPKTAQRLAAALSSAERLQNPQPQESAPHAALAQRGDQAMGIRTARAYDSADHTDRAGQPLPVADGGSQLRKP
jgi:hypothetical protein